MLGLARSDLSSLPQREAAPESRFRQARQNGCRLLRTYGRHESRWKPEAGQVKSSAHNWTPLPAEDDNLNEELCRVLVTANTLGGGETVSLMQTKAKVPDFDEVMKRNKGYGGRILSSMGPTPIYLTFISFCLN